MIKDRPIVFGVPLDGKDPKNQRDFISQHKKQKSFVPGPIYNVGLDMAKNSPTRERMPSVKITKAKLPNYIEQAVLLNKHSPGVGSYDRELSTRYTNRPVQKIFGTYTSKGPKSAFFEDSTFRGLQTPGYRKEDQIVHVEKYK